MIPPKIELQGRVRNCIYDLVARHPEGISTSRLYDLIYADDPNGGPDSRNVVAVIVGQINKIIAAQGLKISAGGGRGALYRLHQL